MAVLRETMTTWGMETAGQGLHSGVSPAIFARHEHSAPIPQSTMSTPYPLLATAPHIMPRLHGLSLPGRLI